MAIRTVVTRGYGNGTFSGSISLVTLRGYSGGPPVFAGSVPDIDLTEDTGSHTYDLSTYFTGATSYSISPSVETGWTFNTSTAELVVDTDEVGVFGPFTVTGTNPAGSDSSNAFDVTVSEAAEESATGGWWVRYEQEMLKREYDERKRRKKRQEALALKAEVDRELALEFRKQEEEQARRQELARLRKLAESHRAEIEALGGRVLQAAERAIINQTFSSMEALERELKRAREEELFLLQALEMILNA